MINPQLLDYVRTQRSAGLSKDAIIQALAAGGWTANDVNEAFMAIDGVHTPPPPPPPPPPPQPVQPRVIVPPPQPYQPYPPAAPVITPTPRPAMSEFSTVPKARRRHSWPLLLILLLVLIIIGGAAAFAYLNPDAITTTFPALQQYFPTQATPQEQTPPESAPIEINQDSATTSPDETPILGASTTASTTIH